MTDTSPKKPVKKPVAVTPVDVAVVDRVEPAVVAPAAVQVPLRSASYLEMRRTLNDGDHGPAVQAVQERMRDKGFWDGPCDGRYGTRMGKAVRQLQAAKGVRVTGEMNPWTWEALNA